MIIVDMIRSIRKKADGDLFTAIISISSSFSLSPMGPAPQLSTLPCAQNTSQGIQRNIGFFSYRPHIYYRAILEKEGFDTRYGPQYFVTFEPFQKNTANLNQFWQSPVTSPADRCTFRRLISAFKRELLFYS